MNISITLIKKLSSTEIQLPASKSLSNRALILHQYLHQPQPITNLSKAEDTIVLQKALASQQDTIDIGHAGTAMRFLTAFFTAQQGKNVVLKGSERMHQRPIKILVDALKQLGAAVNYLENDGFPPLQIKGKQLSGGTIYLDGSVSSQYSSALMLIAPLLSDDLTIVFKNKIISYPYIEMTLKLLNFYGILHEKISNNEIKLIRGKISLSQPLKIESDWSAASYWYSMAALSDQTEFRLKGLHKNSWQGDAEVANLYKAFGVKTIYNRDGITIQKNKGINFNTLVRKTIDFTFFPDLAQTYAVTAAALNVSVRLTGLSSLRIKETDRIAALENELTKIGANVEVVDNDLIIHKREKTDWQKNVTIATYNDHRMAMAFAPMVLLIDNLTIADVKVVEKSYPNFWEDLQKAGIAIKKKEIKLPINFF